MPEKKRELAERIGVRSATDLEAPDEDLVGAPGVEEVECCCCCGGTENLIYVSGESAIEPEAGTSDPSETVAEVESCCVCGSVANVQRCGGCRATSYCSKKCQKSHHSYHGPYCNAINQLERFEKDKVYKSYSVREKQMDFRRQAKMVKLVGRKPILRCLLDGKPVKALWDTGSMIAMVGRRDVGLMKIILIKPSTLFLNFSKGS